MNCFRNALFIFSVALVSSHKAADGTSKICCQYLNPKCYEIPEACRTEQMVTINGGTMNGSTLIYTNSRNLTVNFRFSLPTSNNPNATVTYQNDTETKHSNSSFEITMEKKGINFSLTGNWSNSDMGWMFYYSEDGAFKDCFHRTATNLRVMVSYDVRAVDKQPLTIRAQDGCGVKVILAGEVRGNLDPCRNTLDFGDKGRFDASLINTTVTTENSLLNYTIYSNCVSADVMLYYQENCPLITTLQTTYSPAKQQTETQNQPLPHARLSAGNQNRNPFSAHAHTLKHTHHRRLPRIHLAHAYINVICITITKTLIKSRPKSY
ncbi:unnamed protein product [Calicophoron daubneyi]|uniref:Uncharacterized protein n=1 Tax=Calicophoron daubneyi TaxID=300641 RepID=A0AAV2TP25_CALDB